MLGVHESCVEAFMVVLNVELTVLWLLWSELFRNSLHRRTAMWSIVRPTVNDLSTSSKYTLVYSRLGNTAHIHLSRSSKTWRLVSSAPLTHKSLLISGLKQQDFSKYLLYIKPQPLRGEQSLVEDINKDPGWSLEQIYTAGLGEGISPATLQSGWGQEWSSLALCPGLGGWMSQGRRTRRGQGMLQVAGSSAPLYTHNQGTVIESKYSPDLKLAS